jgi:hypothetical protein
MCRWCKSMPQAPILFMANFKEKPLFPSNQTALDFYLAEAQALESKHGRDFEDLWCEVEQSMDWSAELSYIHSVKSSITTLQYLVNKEKTLK